MPDTPPPTDPSTDEDAASSAATSDKDAAPKATLLIVDDDKSIRMLLSHILSKAGYSLEQAENGKEAVKLLESASIDLIILDIEMPIMDGIRTLGTLRGNPKTKNVPVIMLTGQATPEYVKKSITLGAKGFIVKQSLKPEIVVERIRQALAGPSDAEGPSGAAGSDASFIGPEETQIDQTLWKEKMESIGRVSKEQTESMLEGAELSMIFPSIREEIEESADGDISDNDLVNTVEQEPAIALNVMKGANFSQEKAGSKATDLETALSWVGKSGLVTTLEKVAKIQEVEDDKIRPWLLRWWRHSVTVAQIAAELAPAFGLDQGMVRFAGMVHDIGRLMLLNSDLGPRVAAAYELTRNMTIPTIYAEQTLLAKNHKQIGEDVCDRYGVPKEVGKICITHDYDDTQRARLDEQAGMLSAVVCAADQTAKAIGYGSTLNDELMPLPQIMHAPMVELQVQIDRALAEVETLCMWRIAQAIEPARPAVSLAGLTIVFISTAASECNPFHQALHKAGATVISFSDAKELLDAQPKHDVMVFDQTDASLSLVMPNLRRVANQKAFKPIPKLLLARKSDDPEDLVGQSGITMAVYTTPIRGNTLLEKIKRLTA